MPIYNKLVRDGIPAIVEATGKRAVTRTLNETEYAQELVYKFSEELEELTGATTDNERVEEMADMLELMHAYAALINKDFSEIEEVRKKKAHARGGFQEKVFLIEVQD